MTLDSDKLFPSQEELGPLPLPALSETCERYLRSVRPLLTDAEYAHTEAVVSDFQHGEGEALQAMLEEKAQNERNWMEEWWEQAAYLRTRTTMAIHINWCGVFPDWGFPIDNVGAAALLLDGMLRMRGRIEAGEYATETMRGMPLDMHQFTRVFGMTRVPAEGADELVQASDSRHIAVMRDGAVLIVDVYDERGAPLSVEALRASLAAALRLNDTSCLEDPTVEVGKVGKDGSLSGARCNTSLLTALSRDEWAAERAVLLEDPVSAESLRPSTKEEVARLSHGGTCRDKWFDKSFTAVIFDNARVGVNAEHTPVDAMTILSFIIQSLDGMRGVLSDDAHRQALLAPPSPSAAPQRPPRLLEWRLSPSTRQAIERASCEVGALADDCELCHLAFSHFGKGLVKRSRLHPDFFCQMAIQLAMWRLHKTYCATYETGHTRAFYHGRTDTIRTLSSESVSWCEAMDDPSVDDESKMAALRAACQAHSEQVQRVLSGNGVDRHLLGLYIASHLKGLPKTPPIFTDKAYKLSGGNGNYRLSTSNVGYSPLFGGFAPMTPDGYGVCYSMLEGRMNVMISSWRSCDDTSSTALRTTLSKTLIDMGELCARVASQATASKL